MAVVRRVMLSLTTAVILASPGHAQTQLLTIESGMRDDSHLNGFRQNKPFIGLAGTGVLDGSAGKDAAALAMLSFETRIGLGSISDVGGIVDFAVRRGGITGGVGATLRMDFSDKLPDAQLGGSDGKIPVSYPIVGGYTGFLKLTGGPGGRAFVQVRYVYYPDFMARVYHSEEDRAYAEAAGINLGDVTMQNSSTMRGSVGVTFDRFIIRAQALSEVWRFDRIYNNLNGVYDRDSRMYSLGVSFLL